MYADLEARTREELIACVANLRLALTQKDQRIEVLEKEIARLERHRNDALPEIDPYEGR